MKFVHTNLGSKLPKAFHKIMPELSAPMLKKRGTDVVAFGVSLLEEDAYILILAYSELSDLEQRQGESYRSEEWHGGPGVEAVERIEISLNTIVWLSDSSFDDLRFLKRELSINAKPSRLNWVPVA